MSKRIRRVAVFRSELLPISETFIRDQATALDGWWRPILVGRREMERGLQTPGIPREIVPETRNHFVNAMRFWATLPDPRLVARLRALQLDLVHAHFGTDATEIWPSVKSAGLPMVVTLHGYDINIHRQWWESGHGGLRRRVYPRRLLKMAREPMVRFIAVSRAIQRRAIEYGIPAQKVSVAHVGVDTQRFRPGGVPLEQRQKRILFVGRMVEKKAPLLMVRAFAKVRDEVPEAELVMIGDGPLLAPAKQLAAGLGVPITFAGACPSEEVLAQLHHARVFCLPSVTATNGDAEGLPISVLEAQACGVPVVTSARGAVDEAVVDGESGFCIGEHDVLELVASLSRLLREDMLWLQFSKAARTKVMELFSISTTAMITMSEYEKAGWSTSSFSAQGT